MVLLLTISLFVGSLKATAPADTAIMNQSETQAAYYIQQIRGEGRRAPHLWALAELSKSNPHMGTYIPQYLDTHAISDPVFLPFKDRTLSRQELLKELTFQTGSADLLIALLLMAQEADRQPLIAQFEQAVGFKTGTKVRYKELAAIIAGGASVNTQILPVDSFHFPHFLLLFGGRKYLSRPYLQTLTGQWNKEGFDTGLSGLNKSLFLSALLSADYLMDLYKETTSLYSELIEDTLLPNSTIRLRLYQALDYCMYRQGYYDRSLDISRTFTVPLSIYLGKESLVLNSLMSQAVSLYNIGKIKESQRTNLQVLKEAQEKEIAVKLSSLYNNLGITYWKSGDFERYLELQFKALEEAENQKDGSHQLRILLNLYIYYVNFKETKAAFRYLEKAIKLAKNQNNNRKLGEIYTAIGEFQQNLKSNYALALQNFQKADSLLDKNSDYLLYHNLLYAKAKLFEQLHNYTKALALFTEIQQLASEKEDMPVYADALVDECRINLLQGNLEEARAIYAKIKEASFTNSSFNQIVKAKTVEADYLSQTGKKEQAYRVLQPVLQQVVHRAKKSTSLESGFWNIEPEYLNAFDVMANLLIDTGRNREAVEVLDQLKTINDPALYQNPMVRSSLLNETQLTQYERLSNELDALRKQQLVASKERRPVVQRRIDQLSAQKQVLDRKISKLTTKPSVSLAKVQHRLSGSELLLHITELNDWYYMATITKREIDFKKIRLDSTTRDLFSSAVANLSDGKTNLNQLSTIAEMLQLKSLPNWIDTITIIPDSYLYQLPIDILPLNTVTESYSYGEATYLIERFNTHYVTSVNDLIDTPDSDSKHAFDFVGYGISEFRNGENRNLVPLPFAKSEVQHIADNFTNLSNRKAFLDSLSSESAFKRSAPKAKILHLATHSEISEQDPLYSRIYMSGESKNSDNDFPGQIFAYELFELNLNSDLIMLNSCESGSGSYLQGTGIMGISRALRYAGAKSLVLNLWSVNDMMASEFAITFYNHLNEGKSKTEALQLTKIHFIKQKNANPHFWGPYMLLGDKEPVVQPYKESNLYFAASFMLYFLLFVAFSIYKNRTG